MTDFIDKSSLKFSIPMEWNTDYVNLLLNWLRENIGWRGESPKLF